MKRFSVLILLIAMPFFAHAVTIKGIDIPEIIPANKDNPETNMRGAAIRKVYGFVESYVGVLYVADSGLDDEQIVDADIARRMTFYVTSSRVSARRFTNAIHDGLSINISKQEMAELDDSLQQLTNLFDHKFVEGTVGYIEWVPEMQETRIAIDGQVRGAVKGKKLNDALLKIWIGDHPVSERFKQQVLGHED